jgi:hypothetical protein
MLTQLHLARAILLRLLVSKLGVSMVTGATFARLLKGYKARADGRRAGGRAAGGHILLLGTWYQVPGTPCYQVPGATARYPVPGTGCQVPGTRYLVPDTWYLAPGLPGRSEPRIRAGSHQTWAGEGRKPRNYAAID